MPELEPNELFRFDEIAQDVAEIYGLTNAAGLKKAKRALNRAAIAISGHDRNWSWLMVKDSFMTVASTREYSMQPEVRGDISHLWMEGSNRGRIDRIPTGRFIKSEPDASTTTGTPTLFDYEGVDSSGNVVLSLWPVPSSAIKIFFRYTKNLRPISEDSKDLRVAWGLPQQMLEALTQKAAALCMQGSNPKRFAEQNAFAEALIEEAYIADQAHKNTTYRAPMIEESESYGDVRLPATFGG